MTLNTEIKLKTESKVRYRNLIKRMHKFVNYQKKISNTSSTSRAISLVLAPKKQKLDGILKN